MPYGNKMRAFIKRFPGQSGNGFASSGHRLPLLTVGIAPAAAAMMGRTGTRR
jgi:hypothetical protein